MVWCWSFINKWLVDLCYTGLRPCGRIDLKLNPGRDGVSGIAWLNNKIYVACDKSDKISVYTDEKPFRRLKEDYINIPEMKSPDDMIGSNEHQALYLIDNLWNDTPEASASYASNLWKVTLPEKKATKWPVVDGIAKCLSFNSKGEVMIFVDVDGRFTYNYIDIYRSSDGRRLRINVPLVMVHCGLENTNGNFLIFRMSAGLFSPETDFYEVGVDGKVINTWHLKVDLGQLYRMVLVGDDEVLLCSVEEQMVTLFNMKTKRVKHLLSKDRMKRPFALCYIKDKEQLIVGQRLGFDQTRKVNYSIQFYECLWSSDNELLPSRDVDSELLNTTSFSQYMTFVSYCTACLVGFFISLRLDLPHIKYSFIRIE